MWNRSARKGWRAPVILATALAAALALAGCGGNASGGGDSTAPEGGSGTYESANISFPSTPQSFDPTASVNILDGSVYSLIGASLTRLDFDGQIEMELAESIDFNDDFTEAIVQLKPELLFSDGTPLTAEDVAATYTRNMGVEGSAIDSLMSRFSSVEADGDAVVFRFVEPFPAFAEAMSTRSALVFPKAGLDQGDSFFDQPISAGPYKLDGVWGGNKLELSANENYVDGPRAIGSLTVHSIQDANNVISQLQTGQLDFAGELPPNYLVQLDGNADVTARQAPGWGFYDLRLNNRVAPLDDVRVRQAIDAAIDREALVEQIWGGKNEVLGGFWPRSLEGFDAAHNTPRDLDAAKELLVGTACENGCEIELMYSDADFPFAGQLSLLVQSQLQEAGFTIKLQSVDQSTLIDRLFDESGTAFQMAPGANDSSGPYPDKLLGDALLSSSGISAEFTGYNSPEMDALISQLLVSGVDDRAELAAQIGDLFKVDQPFVTYAERVRGLASRLPDSVITIIGSTLLVAGADG